MFEDRLCKAKRLDNGRWIAGYFFASSAMESRESDEGTERRTFVCPMAQGKPDNSVELVEVDPETVCRCVGLGIRECHQTDRMAYQKRKRLVYDGDLITVFSLTPVGNGMSRRPIAVIQPVWDSTYKAFFAKCAEGELLDIIMECDVPCMDENEDLLFSSWLEHVSHPHA